MADITRLNIYNNNTPDVLKKCRKKDITLYYRSLVWEMNNIIPDAPIIERFESNMKYVETKYPECTI